LSFHLSAFNYYLSLLHLLSLLSSKQSLLLLSHVVNMRYQLSTSFYEIFPTKSLFHTGNHEQCNRIGQTLFWNSFLSPRQPCHTTHSNSFSKSVRIIYPHHPLFGRMVPLIKLWEHKKKHYYVIQLPDESHTRIPLFWADDGKTPLPEPPSDLTVLTATSVRTLIILMR